MDETKKDSGARVALKTIENELSDLHHQKRIDADLIKNQQQQIRALREEHSRIIDHWIRDYMIVDSLCKRKESTTDQSIVAMFAALVVAFVAIGYAVWI